MMPTVTLSEQTYAKMKLAAEPFVDTEDSVVNRALDVLLESIGKSMKPNGKVNSQTDEKSDQKIHLEPGSHQLTHTRLLSAIIDGRQLFRPKWNSMLNELHVMAMKKFGSFDEVRKHSGANLRRGRYEENGYKYLPDADLSIQGVAADFAADHAFRLARSMNISLRLAFEWHDKESAAYPGRIGVMEWTPKSE